MCCWQVFALNEEASAGPKEGAMGLVRAVDRARCVRVYMYLCICIFIYLYAYVYYIYMYVCVCVCLCVFVYM